MQRNSPYIAGMLLVAALAAAQSTTRPKYMEHADIQHSGLVATVTADYPTPLFQALEGIRQEYGWIVNWEEAPCYSSFDVVDDTSPRWRASHPDDKGVTRKAGGIFLASFSEPKAGELSAEEETLRKVIADYNATANPGRYRLLSGPEEQFTVVGSAVRDEAGTFQQVAPILDTLISVSVQRRTAADALDIILEALSSAAGKRVILMSLPNNVFRNTQVSLQAHAVPARQALQQLFHEIRRPLEYDLGFDPDHSSVYILNLSVATRVQPDDSGTRLPVPIDSPK
jgi:hypothetical protein